MKSRINKTSYYAGCRAPRERFLGLTVNDRGRVAARRPMPLGWHCVWFERNTYFEENGAYYVDDTSYSVYMFVDGILSVVFYVEDGALESVAFSVQLTSDQLDRAARALRATGLARHVRAAAKHTLEIARGDARRELGGLLRRLASKRQ